MSDDFFTNLYNAGTIPGLERSILEESNVALGCSRFDIICCMAFLTGFGSRSVEDGGMILVALGLLGSVSFENYFISFHYLFKYYEMTLWFLDRFVLQQLFQCLFIS